MFDLRTSHTDYSVVLGHLSLFLCYKTGEHPQGTNALLGMIKNSLAVSTDSAVLYIFIWDVFPSTSVKDFPVSFSPLHQLICIFKDPDTYSSWVILSNSVIFTFKYTFSGDFPAHPVTKTPHFPMHGAQVQGTRSHMPQLRTPMPQLYRSHTPHLRPSTANK